MSKFMKNFMACELIDPILYHVLVNAGLIRIEVKNDKLKELFVHQRVRELFPVEMLDDLQILRKRFGAIRINNWYKVKSYVNAIECYSSIKKLYYKDDKVVKNAGTRPFSPSIGSPKSMHCFRKALDLKFLNHEYSADFIRDYLNRNQTKFSVKRLEDGVSWVHIDYLQTGLSGLYIFTI